MSSKGLPRFTPCGSLVSIQGSPQGKKRASGLMCNTGQTFTSSGKISGCSRTTDSIQGIHSVHDLILEAEWGTTSISKYI